MSLVPFHNTALNETYYESYINYHRDQLHHLLLVAFLQCQEIFEKSTSYCLEGFRLLLESNVQKALEPGEVYPLEQLHHQVLVEELIALVLFQWDGFYYLKIKNNFLK